MDVTFKVYWTVDSCYKMAEGFNFTVLSTSIQERNALNLTVSTYDLPTWLSSCYSVPCLHMMVDLRMQVHDMVP